MTDDDPDGFADLRDAYTLFAESRKKGNAAQRGRFNLGEKLVLALAKSAWIETTTGTVEFTEDGTRQSRHAARERLDVPGHDPHDEGRDRGNDGGRPAADCPGRHHHDDQRPAVAGHARRGCLRETLPTVVADDEGVLRKTTRRTQVCVYEPLPGETATLYEMGIPVVETGDRYHVDVQQKVPLNMDRDNVTPAYLRAIRVAVLNATHDPG